MGMGFGCGTYSPKVKEWTNIHQSALKAQLALIFIQLVILLAENILRYPVSLIKAVPLRKQTWTFSRTEIDKEVKKL